MIDFPEYTDEVSVLSSKVLEKAKEIFGSLEKSEQWLNSPNILLDGNSPIQVLKSPLEAEKVMAILDRIEYGVFS